jgi:hypothetical protein
LAGLRGLLGLIPGGNGGRYNHRLREHATTFAASLYLCAKRNASISNEVVETVNCLPRKHAMLKLQLMALKALRIAYLTTMNQ